MTRFVTDRMPTLASFVSALILVLTLSANLKASCGDYVQVGSHGAQRPTPSTNQHPIPVAPCHGPHCSRHHAPLTPVPSSPTTNPNNDWFCLPLGSDKLPDERIGRIKAAEINLQTKISFDIFHPPR